MEHEIIIWDENAGRINAMEPNLRVAMSRCNIKASVQLNSEPPLLSRNNLIGSTPAIQIDGGEFWRHTIGVAVTIEQFEQLFAKLRSLGIIKD